MSDRPKGAPFEIDPRRFDAPDIDIERLRQWVDNLLPVESGDGFVIVESTPLGEPSLLKKMWDKAVEDD